MNVVSFLFYRHWQPSPTIQRQHEVLQSAFSLFEQPQFAVEGQLEVSITPPVQVTKLKLAKNKNINNSRFFITFKSINYSYIFANRHRKKWRLGFLH